MITREDLQALGLREEELGLTDSVARAPDDAARGFAATQVELDSPGVEKQLREMRWVRVPAPVAEGLQLTIFEAAEHPGLLLITSAERSLELQAVPELPEAVWRSPDDPGEAVVDLTRCRVVAVLERALLLQRIEGRLELTPTGAPAPLEPPLAAWLAAASDPWLAAEVARGQEATASSWERAVAAGTLGRLRELAPGEARRVLERLLRGESGGEETAPWRWASGFSAPQRREVAEEATRRAASLLERLRALMAEEEGGPADPAWCDALQAVLVERDALHSGLKVLAEAGERERARAIPQALDAAGRAALRALPRLPEVGAAARLRRAAQVEPDAWWAMPALESR